MDGIFTHRSRITRVGVIFGFVLLSLSRAVMGYELEQSVNQAAVSAFPTAFDQPTRHLAQVVLEMTDVKEPIVNLASLRYGFQFRNFQLLTESRYQLAPEHEFDYLQVRGKLRVLNLDEFRTYMAVGLLGRYVQYNSEIAWRIDDHPTSLFVILTMELFPLQDWGGFLLNFYLDNRYFNTGLKVQLYPSIQFVAEGDYLHNTWREDKFSGRVGFDVSGENSFHFQLLYSDEGKHVLTQIGFGF